MPLFLGEHPPHKPRCCARSHPRPTKDDKTRWRCRSCGAYGVYEPAPAPTRAELHRRSALAQVLAMTMMPPARW